MDLRQGGRHLAGVRLIGAQDSLAVELSQAKADLRRLRERAGSGGRPDEGRRMAQPVRWREHLALSAHAGHGRQQVPPRSRAIAPPVWASLASATASVEPHDAQKAAFREPEGPAAWAV